MKIESQKDQALGLANFTKPEAMGVRTAKEKRTKEKKIYEENIFWNDLDLSRKVRLSNDNQCVIRGIVIQSKNVENLQKWSGNAMFKMKSIQVLAVTKI